MISTAGLPSCCLCECFASLQSSASGLASLSSAVTCVVCVFGRVTGFLIVSTIDPIGDAGLLLRLFDPANIVSTVRLTLRTYLSVGCTSSPLPIFHVSVMHGTCMDLVCGPYACCVQLVIAGMVILFILAFIWASCYDTKRKAELEELHRTHILMYAVFVVAASWDIAMRLRCTLLQVSV